MSADESAFATFLSTATGNPAASIPAEDKLAYILAIVAGALFALGALLALFNLIRDRIAVHFFIILFGLERVATFVIRALIYHHPKRKYFEVYEILETVGYALLILILWHIWAATGRTRTPGSSKRGKGCHCCVLFIATFVAVAAAGAFAAGVIFQDRSNTDKFDRGFQLRKAAVVAYGALLFFLDIACIFLCCRRGARATAPGLLLASLLLSAKAGWIIYAMWHSPAKYYENKYWYPLGVLTELLALLIIVMPGFLRKAMGRPGPTLPVTDHGQYMVGNQQPHSPMFPNGPSIAPLYIK